MVFTQWQRARLAAVLGNMAGTPAQVETVAPLMDQLELDATPAATAAPAGDHNLPITSDQAQLLLDACRRWPGWTLVERGQMRCLLNDLSMAADATDQDPPSVAIPDLTPSSWLDHAPAGWRAGINHTSDK